MSVQLHHLCVRKLTLRFRNICTSEDYQRNVSLSRISFSDRISLFTFIKTIFKNVTWPSDLEANGWRFYLVHLFVHFLTSSRLLETIPIIGKKRVKKSNNWRLIRGPQTNSHFLRQLLLYTVDWTLGFMIDCLKHSEIYKAVKMSWKIWNS